MSSACVFGSYRLRSALCAAEISLESLRITTKMHKRDHQYTLKEVHSKGKSQYRRRPRTKMISNNLHL